jgi:hypothetical protein
MHACKEELCKKLRESEEKNERLQQRWIRMAAKQRVNERSTSRMREKELEGEFK